jgi:uncharacterized protein (TIGR02594 family)
VTSADALTVAQRLIGTHEVAGAGNNPFIVWALSTCNLVNATDEVPWCSAFVNAIALLCGLERTQSASARSWLIVGLGMPEQLAAPGDVVIFKRGTPPQPGPAVLMAQGHVGFFVSRHNGDILVLGGNQGNAVSIESFPAADLLGVRRLRNA